MMSPDKALLRQLLMIERPWEIREYKLDLATLRCEVWVAPEGERGGWFGRERRAPRVVAQHSWDHLPLGGLQVRLHVGFTTGLAPQQAPWMGEPGQPFTRALVDRLHGHFREGVTVQALCGLMGLRVQDVWRCRYAYDNGPGKAPPPTVEAAPPGLATTARVPDLHDPVWQRLVEGDLTLDIRVLSLKLMLTRVRAQLDRVHDEGQRLQQLHELHRYFVKHERLLAHELAQMHRT